MNHNQLYNTLRQITGTDEYPLDIVITNYYQTQQITSAQAQGGNVYLRNDEGELHQVEKDDSQLIELIYNAIEQPLNIAV